MKQVKCDNVLYNAQFLLCSHKLSKSERQKILRKRKSCEHKRTILQKRRSDYAKLEPVKKTKILEQYQKTATEWYRSMDSFEKNALVATKAKQKRKF